MVTLESIKSQLNTLELQVRALRAQVKVLEGERKRRTFGELYGVMKGVSDTTAEEIDACQLRNPPDIEP